MEETARFPVRRIWYKMTKPQRQKVFDYVKKTYGILPTKEPKWKPDSHVFFHKEGGSGTKRKLFGIIMLVNRKYLGEEEDEQVYVLNVRTDPEAVPLLTMSEGIYPAYHMTKKSWVTVILDGTVKDKNIYRLLDDSYVLTLPAGSRKSLKAARGPKNWLVPANPKYYDVEEAFRHRKVIEWKQSTDVREGDLVYLYIAAPVSAIRYKCRAVRVNIPLDPPDEMLHIDRLMEIELLCDYGRELMPLSRMTEDFHVLAVRGPRYLPGSLKYELDMWEGGPGF